MHMRVQTKGPKGGVKTILSPRFLERIGIVSCGFHWSVGEIKQYFPVHQALPFSKSRSQFQGKLVFQMENWGVSGFICIYEVPTHSDTVNMNEHPQPKQLKTCHWWEMSMAATSPFPGWKSSGMSISNEMGMICRRAFNDYTHIFTLAI